jgi:SM-20-related protein
LGLTAQWRVEWGGLLLFHDDPVQIAGQMPHFNCLDLFAVPALHSVSQVTSFAKEVRYSATGWFRTEQPSA